MDNKSIRISRNSFLLTRPELCSPVLTPPRRATKAIKRKSKCFAKQNDFIISGKGGQLLKTSDSQLMKTLWQHLLFPARIGILSAWPEKGRQGLSIEEEPLISPSGCGRVRINRETNS